MVEDTDSLVPLTRDRLGEATAMLGRAFVDDAMSYYLFRGSARSRERKIAWSMSCLARFGLRYGTTEITPELDGLACWFRSDVVQMSPVRMLTSGFWAAPVRLGFGGWRRFFGLAAASEKVHATMDLGTHWYLMLLAVDPSRQGQGLGSRLLQRGLARADRDGLPCALETTRQETVDFYKKHGFEIAGRAVLDEATDVGLWTMVRQRHE